MCGKGQWGEGGKGEEEESTECFVLIIVALFHPGLLHFLCYRWMLDYDDGESRDVLYVHNTTNQQVDCYTLLSGFQPSWHRLAISCKQRPFWIPFMNQHLNPATALSDHCESGAWQGAPAPVARGKPANQPPNGPS